MDPWRRLLTVFLPFACGYYLSFFFRTINAVVAPHLTAELGLGPEALGLLTGAYFLAFALSQVPIGVLLDRYGPRRVQAGLLLIASAGALGFAHGQDATTLALARAAIGFGVSGSLMSAMKALLTWFPRERMALVTGTFLVFGGLGALTATRPLEAMLGLVGWRTLFLGLTCATLAVSALVYLIVPDTTRGRATGSLARQTRDVAIIFRDPLFWRIGWASGLHLSVIFAVMGLWAAPWLAEVQRLDRQGVVDHLLAMAISFTVGTFLIGLLTDRLMRWNISQPAVFAGGLVCFIVILLAIVLRAPLPSMLLWVAFAAFGNLPSLPYGFVPDRYPDAFSGRVLTAMNVVALTVAFGLQWAMGVVIGLWPPLPDGLRPPEAHQAALALALALYTAAAAYFLWPRGGWWSGVTKLERVG
jgi:sugar phosphate permease